MNKRFLTTLRCADQYLIGTLTSTGLLLPTLFISLLIQYGIICCSISVSQQTKCQHMSFHYSKQIFFDMRLFFSLCCVLLIFNFGCEESDNNPIIPPPNNDSLVISEAFPLLGFNRPVDLQSPGDSRLFVVEQRGIIQVFDND